MSLNAVLDMATLRASQRILCSDGIRADAGRFVDIDIAATAQLIEAIVLFNQILVPDIGHREHSSVAGIWGSAVRGLLLDHEVRADAERLASAWLDRWCDVTQFAALIGANPDITRSSISSSYCGSHDYLVSMALMLGIPDKYKSSVIHCMRGRAMVRDCPLPILPEQSLLEALRKTFTQGTLQDPVMLEGESRRVFDVVAGSSPHILFDPEFLLFFGNVVWTAYRSKYYSLISRIQDATYFPHPLRNSLVAFAISSDYMEDDPGRKRANSFRLFTSALEKVYQESIDQLSELPGVSLLPLNIPCMFPYILRKAKDRKYLLETAYEVREGRGAVALRTRIGELDEALRCGDVRSLVAIRNEIQGLQDWFRKCIGLDERREINFKFSLLGITASLPVRWLPKQLDKPLYPTKPHLALLRDSFDVLTRISSLGALHEILSDEIGKSVSNDIQGMDGWTGLMTAVANDSVKLVETLASKGCDVNRPDRYGLTPLAIAASNGLTEIAEILVRAGADIQARSGFIATPLTIAAWKGHTDVVRVLLAHGAGGHNGEQTNYALSAAISNGHCETAKTIVVQSRAIDPATHFTPAQFESAIRKGWADLVQYLIENGVSPDAHSSNASTPLITAIEERNRALVEYLIAAGADLDLRNKPRNTALHVAANQGLPSFVRLLIDAGSDVRAKNAQGQTVLHFYIDQENKKMVQYLLDHGADPNSKNNRSETGLMLSVLKGNLDLCETLLKHGADIRIKNMKGHSAINIAETGRQILFFPCCRNGRHGVDRIWNQVGYT